MGPTPLPPPPLPVFSRPAEATGRSVPEEVSDDYGDAYCEKIPNRSIRLPRVQASTSETDPGSTFTRFVTPETFKTFSCPRSSFRSATRLLNARRVKEWTIEKMQMGRILRKTFFPCVRKCGEPGDRGLSSLLSRHYDGRYRSWGIGVGHSRPISAARRSSAEILEVTSCVIKCSLNFEIDNALYWKRVTTVRNANTVKSARGYFLIKKHFLKKKKFICLSSLFLLTKRIDFLNSELAYFRILLLRYQIRSKFVSASF